MTRFIITLTDTEDDSVKVFTIETLAELLKIAPGALKHLIETAYPEPEKHD